MFIINSKKINKNNYNKILRKKFNKAILKKYYNKIMKIKKILNNSINKYRKWELNSKNYKKNVINCRKKISIIFKKIKNFNKI